MTFKRTGVRGSLFLFLVVGTALQLPSCAADEGDDGTSGGRKNDGGTSAGGGAGLESGGSGEEAATAGTLGTIAGAGGLADGASAGSSAGGSEDSSGGASVAGTGNTGIGGSGGEGDTSSGGGSGGIDPGENGGTDSGADCGGLGDECCSNSSCDADLDCLADASCSCVQKIVGHYVLRVDGKLLRDGETPVLNAATGLPLEKVTDVADGESHGCVLVDGSVWCWALDGYGNAGGQLGNGTTTAPGSTYRATQVLVAANTPLTSVASLATGYFSSTCAITTAGELYCWGLTSWLVNGGATLASPYAIPITTDGITPLTSVLQIALDLNYACAIVQATGGNEVRCWGSNANQNLGTGTSNNEQYPTKKVLGLTAPTKVAVGGSAGIGKGFSLTTCVLDGDKVLCFGANGPQSPTPIVLSNGTTVLNGLLDVEQGRGFNEVPAFCARRNNATLWCWGAGFASATYATNFGVSNVVDVGAAEQPRFLTSDGVYHVAAGSSSPKCGPL